MKPPSLILLKVNTVYTYPFGKRPRVVFWYWKCLICNEEMAAPAGDWATIKILGLNHVKRRHSLFESAEG